MAKKLTLEQRVTNLETRNRKVEGDKAWEVSWQRRGMVMVLIYLTVVFYLRFVVHIDPWINALVPVIGYSVSTVTITRLKAVWLKRRSH
jgi:hypothetical protein